MAHRLKSKSAWQDESGLCGMRQAAGLPWHGLARPGLPAANRADATTLYGALALRRSVADQHVRRS